MLHPYPIDTVVCDPLITTDLSTYSPSSSRTHTRSIPPHNGRTHFSKSTSAANLRFTRSLKSNIMDSEAPIASGSGLGEDLPLLGGDVPPKKPFYRARPLWIVPFVITAALTRAITLAPRIEVYTQLACNQIYGHQYPYSGHLSQTLFLNALPPIHSIVDPVSPYISYGTVPELPGHVFLGDGPEGMGNNDDDTEDPRRLPSQRCLGDAAVQAKAARLQMIMTTTMGLLSALTTGWWGRFGERHGRTRVLAMVSLGMFCTDLIFILVSTPSSSLSHHGHKLLLIAPIIEGLLGGWSTLQSNTGAYVSDCTSSGSRAQIFSRFTGVFYVGLSAGPSLGGWLIQHPIKFLGGTSGPKTVTSVFYIAIAGSFFNCLTMLLVYPESRGKEQRKKATAEYNGHRSAGKRRLVDSNGQDEQSRDEEETEERKEGIIRSFLKPLAVFLPVVVMNFNGFGRKRRDWSLTFLAVAFFTLQLSSGVYQLKYLYAEHIYGWAAEQLSYYISFMGASRCTFLLFLLPTIIALFKPKPQTSLKGKAKKTVSIVISANGKKPKPTLPQLGHEIDFDLMLTRCSILVDIISNTLVILLPAPSYKVHSLTKGQQQQSAAHMRSQILFVLATAGASLGSGAVPAIQSLALCILQVRELDSGTSGGEDEREKNEASVGELFGALAVLQAVGSMILGPILFGMLYSATVAKLPKAIFVVAMSILLCSLTLILLVRNPVRGNSGVLGKAKKRSKDMYVERGRSRISKDLKGGAARFEPVSYGSIDIPEDILAGGSHVHDPTDGSRTY